MSHTSRTSWITRHTKLTGCGAVLALMTVGACAAPDEAREGSGPKPAASAPAAKGGDAAQKPAEEEKKAAVRGSGTFEVGKDVQPGTYRTSGNGGGCYWERSKDSSGEIDSIIANDNVVGASYVTIAATDEIFKSSDCKDREAVDPQAADGSPKTEFSGKAGMLKVGTDIAPGTYKSALPRGGGRRLLLGAHQVRGPRRRLDHREREPHGSGGRDDRRGRRRLLHDHRLRGLEEVGLTPARTPPE